MNEMQTDPCSDCTLPPDWIIIEIKKNEYSYKCRTCGDNWIEKEN
jgi:hypothetical protein